jgi:hypothetical protein
MSNLATTDGNVLTYTTTRFPIARTLFFLDSVIAKALSYLTCSLAHCAPGELTIIQAFYATTLQP